MLTVELAILEVLREKGISADCAAGLSLGEYGALGAAGVMSFEDLFRLIQVRGKAMQEAYPEGGAMAALLGQERERVEELCRGERGVAVIANDNCVGQLVISGEEEAIGNVCAQIRKEGWKVCSAEGKRPLPFSPAGACSEAVGRSPFGGPGERSGDSL